MNTTRIWLIDREEYLEVVHSSGTETVAREVPLKVIGDFLRSWQAHCSHLMAVARLGGSGGNSRLADYSAALSGILLGPSIALKGGGRLEFSANGRWSSLPVEILPVKGGGYSYQKLSIVRDLRLAASNPTQKARRLLLLGDNTSKISAGIQSELDGLLSAPKLQKLRPRQIRSWVWAEILTLFARPAYWHFAGHGGPDWIELAGLRLCPKDLAGLRINSPCIFLNGCDTAVAGNRDSLVRAFLSAGAGSVVGFLGQIETEAATVGAHAFWTAMATSGPDQAVSRARKAIEDKYGPGNPAALLLVDYRLTTTSARSASAHRMAALATSISAAALVGSIFALGDGTLPIPSPAKLTRPGGDQPVRTKHNEFADSTPTTQEIHKPTTERKSAKPAKEEGEHRSNADAIPSPESNAAHEANLKKSLTGDGNPAPRRGIREQKKRGGEEADHIEFEFLARQFIERKNAFFSRSARESIVRNIRYLDVSENEKILRLHSYMYDSDQ